MSLKLIIENEDSDKEIEENNYVTIELQLGDIIYITDPTNEKLNDQTFLIDYIDLSKMYLINTETLDNIKVKISDDGSMGNGTITKIAILSRSSEQGYAKQNGLLPGKWININFGGEFPAIITGEITNLENDMIEVRTIDNDNIYLNFDYKGIPEDLPISTIEIREKPQESILEREAEEQGEEQGIINEEEEQGAQGEDQGIINEEMGEPVMKPHMVKTDKIQINIPTKNIKDQLREFVLRADQITFGNEVLGPIVQYVDVASKFQRYSLETQVSELMDDLLSTIPDSQRTNRVLNNIHTIIERFKQLREHFSFVDEYGNVEGALTFESDYKPIWEYFNKFNTNLYWILPVVKNIKKVYNVKNDEDNDESNAIVDLSLSDDLTNIRNIINNFKSNTYPVEQNKYSDLNVELNPYFTPFESINDENMQDILIEKNVGCDINTIVDNLEDMYSTIIANNSIRSRRFVIQKYNLGLTKLDTLEVTGSRITTIRVKMTNPDTMTIKSFMTLPEPTIRFSRINLPGTTLLDKANLNLVFLNYWQLLNKKTNVTNLFVDNLNTDIEYTEFDFANNIKNYILNLSETDKKQFTNSEIYSQFIKRIIPKTKIIFKLMEKYIKGKLSIVDVVSYLEPFLIYPDNLTYMQYTEIITFIDKQISNYNKQFIEKSRMMSGFKKLINQPSIFTIAYPLISTLETSSESTKNLKMEVFQGYDIDTDFKNNYVFTNSELLRKIMIKDSSNLYTSAIALRNMSLMFPSEFINLFEEEKDNVSINIKDAEGKNKCKTIIIAKRYTTSEELQNDNGKDIYFDKKYDKTNYGLLDQYEDLIVKMTPDNFMDHLITNLKKIQNLNDNDAEYLANTLIDGYKKVLDGQYAILYNSEGKKESDIIDYYKRKGNKWVLDTDVDLQDLNTDDPNLLCNFQDKCVSVPEKNIEKCESIPLDKLTMQSKLLKNIIGEFDDKYNFTKKELQQNIIKRFDYHLELIESLTKIENINMLKYNKQKYKLGATLDDDITGKSIQAASPNAKLLNLILSQGDFVKKQNDIIRFVNTYTRPAIVDGYGPLGEKETLYWLYCIKTNLPLLPVFKYNMATAYISDQGGYNDFVELLISKVGKLSDDGNLWTDEHSGWTIKKIDDDYEEGYDDGFKISSRATLENDAGNNVTSDVSKIIKYNTPETRSISNIVNAISVAMGINIEVQKEFIVNSVVESIQTTMVSEDDYKTRMKEMSEKNKKIMSYKDFYNNSLLYYTLSMVLIAIQTAIPSIKTRKTHPGCVRSFVGFPFEGNGDYSALNYIACIAHDIRESGEPWNVLKGKKQEFITNKIKSIIDNVLLNVIDVKRKFQDKTEYLLTNSSEEIPEEHNILNWVHFLPPLVPIKIHKLSNVSDDFKKTLMNDLRTGSNGQREKILIVSSKIIQFSLSIQEKIQEIVQKQDLLLNKSNNEHYLENSCCETNDRVSTISYFVKQNGEIEQYNETVRKLTDILDDIIGFTKSGLFYSRINTKNIYPAISNNFDEKTIYLTFIHYCKFKSLIPIPENLLPLCTNKPDMLLMNENMPIDEMIQKLKMDGREYNYETFLRLLQLIGRENIVDINLDNHLISPITKLSGLLESIDDQNDDIIEGSLRTLIYNLIDTFDVAANTVSQSTKDLNNFLIKNNNIMKLDIIDFINKNKGTNVSKSAFNKAVKTINNLSVWESDKSTRNQDNISDDKMYTIVNFFKTFVTNFASVFPNIILNKVEYNTVIPNYLGLSSSHSNKIKNLISDYYKKLYPFYGIAELYNVLTTIQTLCKNIDNLSKITPSFTTIKHKDIEIHPIFDERTSKFLFEYYLLKVFVAYIDLSDENDMIVTEITKKNVEEDLFTEEFLEDRETRVDFADSTNITNTQLLSGNKKGLRQQIAHLLVTFISIMEDQKDAIDISYEDIMDRVLKLKEREKDIVTDRLKFLTDEERDADTILKINKLGVWSKGLQKGLTQYVKETYDDEREFRDEMDNLEKKIRSKNKDVTNDNIDQYMEDYLEDRDANVEIEKEEYNMDRYIDDYGDGNYEGDEVENYDDFDS